MTVEISITQDTPKKAAKNIEMGKKENPIDDEELANLENELMMEQLNQNKE